jgi:hypothetical protein
MILPARKSTCISLKFAFQYTLPIFREIGETGRKLAISYFRFKFIRNKEVINIFKEPFTKSNNFLIVYKKNIINILILFTKIEFAI